LEALLAAALRNRHTDTIANTEPRGQRSTRLDVIFGLAAPAVDILVKDTGVACFQIGDDEARVSVHILA
jgi:hypothetical protein